MYAWLVAILKGGGGQVPPPAPPPPNETPMAERLYPPPLLKSLYLAYQIDYSRHYWKFITRRNHLPGHGQSLSIGSLWYYTLFNTETTISCVLDGLQETPLEISVSSNLPESFPRYGCCLLSSIQKPLYTAHLSVVCVLDGLQQE